MGVRNEWKSREASKIKVDIFYTCPMAAASSTSSNINIYTKESIVYTQKSIANHSKEIEIKIEF